MAQTCIVTGANRGIGLELARQLSARGDTVIGTARNPDSAADRNKLGIQVETLDVTNPKSIAALAKKLKGVPVDLLVHNAAVGVAGPAVEKVTAEEIEEHFRANALGPLLVTQALLPNLRAGERKLVVALSSGLGSIEENSNGGWVAYRISKTALHQVMRTLSAELAEDGLSFVLISPGWVRTRMGGQGDPLSPEDSVKSVLKVIDRLSPKDTGKFFNERGREIPW